MVYIKCSRTAKVKPSLDDKTERVQTVRYLMKCGLANGNPRDQRGQTLGYASVDRHMTCG